MKKKEIFNDELLNSQGPIFDDISHNNPIEKNDFSSVTEILNRNDVPIQPSPLNSQINNNKNNNLFQKLSSKQQPYYKDQKDIYQDEFEKPDPQDCYRKKHFDELSSINTSPRQKQVTLSVNPYLNLDELHPIKKTEDQFKEELKKKLGPSLQSPYGKLAYGKNN